MSTGAHTPSFRIRRQTSKPSIPGSIRSRTIASNSAAPGHPDGVVAGARDVDRVALLDQAAAEQVRHLQLVLDDQDPHALISFSPLR